MNNSTYITIPTNSSLDHKCEEKRILMARFQNVSYVSCITLNLIGNVTIIILLLHNRFRFRGPLSRLEGFLLHIAIADIGVALFNQLSQFIWMQTMYFLIPGDLPCRLLVFTQMVPVYASTYILVICSVDRYLAICFPLFSRRHLSSDRVIRNTACLGWLFGTLVSSPQLFVFSYNPEKRQCLNFLSENQIFVYIHVVFILVFALPLTVMIFCNSAICIVLCQGPTVLNTLSNGTHNRTVNLPASHTESRCIRFETVRKDDSQLDDDDPDSTVCRSRGEHLAEAGGAQLARIRTGCLIRSVRMTLVVCLCYALCWTPYFGSQLYWAYHPETDECRFSYLTVIFLAMAGLNSCSNPIIYGIFTVTSRLRHRRKLLKRQETQILRSRTNSVPFELQSTAHSMQNKR